MAVVFVLAVSNSAEGQNSGRVFRPTSQGGGRQASQPIQPVQATSAAPMSPGYPYPGPPGYPAYPAYPAYPVAYTVLPAIIMSDGSIYANLGYGYIPVRHACAQPRVLNGSSLLYRGGNPLTTTQPAPAQLTASQEMIRAGQSRGVPATQRRVASACYRMDPYGPVVVVR